LIINYLVENMPQASRDGGKSIRVVLCAYPGIFADSVIQSLQEIQMIELAGLVYSTRIFSARETWMSGAMRLIKTSGISYAALQFMQTDVYLLLRKFSRFVPADVAVPVFQTKNINQQTGLDFLKNLEADVILLANFNQKVSETVLSVAALACLNIHPSLLPEFKGVDPVFAALYANEPYLGVTVHLVDGDFDTGDIIAQTMMPADKNRSVFYHQLHLFQEGAKLAANIIKHLPQGIDKQVQKTDGNYDSWPAKAKIKDFKKRGGQLINYADYSDAVKRLLLT
jgi:methionyl-tRNA formyltransferase